MDQSRAQDGWTQRSADAFAQAEQPDVVHRPGGWRDWSHWAGQWLLQLQSGAGCGHKQYAFLQTWNLIPSSLLSKLVGEVLTQNHEASPSAFLNSNCRMESPGSTAGAPDLLCDSLPSNRSTCSQTHALQFQACRLVRDSARLML